ncbi:hypothetical protein P9847_01020 [Paenibacillus chibensis]|uniref:Uncharacterized protein n=1 Tax=Paenibacillus chibensis TaxID=59846 RepID=A0ABU6PLX2_9BACL|nr:hypothetical protein [Paenibacillus chibensis]
MAEASSACVFSPDFPENIANNSKKPCLEITLQVPFQGAKSVFYTRIGDVHCIEIHHAKECINVVDSFVDE